MAILVRKGASSGGVNACAGLIDFESVSRAIVMAILDEMVVKFWACVEDSWDDGSASSADGRA